ncbi:MAG: SAM-dependent DNA methyltransferase [Candidatus Riflebacteria bacterium]|nr:SAM-dependent DNA methyltransferase [Candidatus Riflebacteria bacterium]
MKNPVNDNLLTLNQLESHLWEAANILRGTVDAADFKTYVFPLLFFKRISDVFDEEYASALAESSGDEEYAFFPQNYRFQIPKGCHWRDVRVFTVNVGQALQKAIRGIEKANPETLFGIFGDAAWTNKERLPDALLRDLIEHFSRYSLGNQAAQADILGQAYEYLIKKFADATNKKAGEFYTPRAVVKLMIKILDPGEGESIYDPACGTGGMLLEAIHHVKENHGDDRTLWGKLYGQEKNLTTSAIARMNLFLHAASDFQIVRGDTLRQPAFFSGDNLATFDCVIANPPFSLEKWGDEVWASDPYGRNFAGMPPGKTGDYAWVQHMVKSMAPGTGRMAVVLPHGVLFRMAKEGAIRKKLLQMDILEAVIGLGPTLFYGTGLAACILVFRHRKPKDRKKKVLILDASREFKAGRAQNELLPEHVEHIHTWYRDFKDVKGLSRVVTLEDLSANDFNLNISRYVEPQSEHQAPTVEEARKSLHESAVAAFAAEEKLVAVLKREGFLS